MSYVTWILIRRAGFIAGQGAELGDAWRRAHRDAHFAEARGSAKLTAWLRFLSPEGPGAAFRGRFLTWVKVSSRVGDGL